MAALRAQHALNAVRGIGLCGQMHGATMIDTTGQPLAPCMLWNDTRAADLTRAVLEGVTHAFVDNFNALKSTGTQINRLIGVGGGTKSAYRVKAIATALYMPIDIPIAGDFGDTFRAARLGMMAATRAGSEIATTPEIAHAVEPDTTLTPHSQRPTPDTALHIRR